jgi:hypothetical protein
MNGEKRDAHKISFGNPVKKRPLETPKCRWLDNIKMNLEEVGCGAMDWIDLVQDRDQWRALENMVMNLQVP